MADSARIEKLRAEARYHRERYDLYRAKMYGGDRHAWFDSGNSSVPTKAPRPAFVGPSKSAPRTAATDAPFLRPPHATGSQTHRARRNASSFSEQSWRRLAGAQPPVSISTQVECRVLTQ
jgi:hypothetical protein